MRGRWLQRCDMKMERSQWRWGCGTPGEKKSTRKWGNEGGLRCEGNKKRVRTLQENYGNVKSKRESEPKLQRVNGCVSQWGPTQSGSNILSATIAADWVGQGFAGLNTSQPHKAIERLARVIWPLNASSLLRRWARSGYSARLLSRWTSGTTLYRDASKLRSRTRRKRNALFNLESYVFIPFFFPSPSDQLLACCVIKHHGATGEQWPQLDLLFACFCFVSRADLSSATLSLTHAFFQLSDSQRTS